MGVLFLEKYEEFGNPRPMGRDETLLEAHSVLCTRNLDEARAVVAARYCDHKLDQVAGGDLHVTHNHVRGAHVSLNLLSYGADVTIDPGELQHFYLLQIPLSGSAEVTHRGENVTATEASATILNPDRPTKMIWKAGCRKLMVQIDANFLDRVATDAAGIKMPGPVRFDPCVDLTGTRGRRLRHLSLTIAKAIDAGHVNFTRQDLKQFAIERDIAMALLEAQPSNVTHLFKGPDTAAAAHCVRRAVEFIQSALHNAVTLDDIAEAAHVHPRTLQTAFRQQMGCTPMQYVRDLRLDQARYFLLQRQKRLHVGQVAYDCGYTHLGRFSRDYRARFGQTPRETH